MHCVNFVLVLQLTIDVSPKPLLSNPASDRASERRPGVRSDLLNRTECRVQLTPL